MTDYIKTDVDQLRSGDRIRLVVTSGDTIITFDSQVGEIKDDAVYSHPNGDFLIDKLDLDFLTNSTLYIVQQRGLREPGVGTEIAFTWKGERLRVKRSDAVALYNWIPVQNHPIYDGFSWEEISNTRSVEVIAGTGNG